MAKGYIYVLTNPAMPGVVKVGRTERDPSDRARELQTTGVPNPFALFHSRFVNDCEAFEKQIHHVLAQRGVRLSSNREFFELQPHEAVALIDLLATEEPHCAIDFSRQSELTELVNALPLPLGNEEISGEKAAQLASRLAALGRQGSSYALKKAAALYEVNFLSALKYREFCQEYLYLARQEAEWVPLASSNGRATRNSVGREVAEYLWCLYVHRWLVSSDFEFISSFLLSGERFVYEGYTTEISRLGFPANILTQAENV
jgi:hypothetical protein